MSEKEVEIMYLSLEERVETMSLFLEFCFDGMYSEFKVQLSEIRTLMRLIRHINNNQSYKERLFTIKKNLKNIPYYKMF